MPTFVEGFEVTCGSENVLKLTDPDEWTCELFGLQLGHTELSIRISSPVETTPKYVHFAAVQYLRLPTRWKGANFRAATLDQFLDVYAIINREPREELEHVFKEIDFVLLYNIGRPEHQMQIYGSLLAVTDKPQIYASIACGAKLGL